MIWGVYFVPTRAAISHQTYSDRDTHCNTALPRPLLKGINTRYILIVSEKISVILMNRISDVTRWLQLILQIDAKTTKL